MAKVAKEDIHNSSILPKSSSSPSSSFLFTSSSADNESATSTKPTSRSSSLHTPNKRETTPPMLSSSRSAEKVTIDAPQRSMEAIPDSDDLETSSLRAAISPRAAKVAGARKSQRRSSRFVQDLEVDNPRVGSRSDLNTDTPRTGRHVARNPSSITFPPAMSESRDNLLQDSIDSLHMDWKLDSPRKTASPRKRGAQIDSAASRRKSSRLSTVMDTAMDAANALGKRSRDAFEQGVEKIRTIQRRKNAGQRLTEGERLLLEEHTKKREMDEHRENTTLRLRPGKNLKDLPPLPKGWSYNVPEDEMPAAKRAKVVEENKKKNQVADSEDEDEAKLNKAIAPQPRRKKWLTQGLYVGQKRGYDPRLKPAQNHKKQAGRLTKGLEEENSILPLPMFAGEALLERGRNFKLPFDIFCPLPVGQPKPEEWKKIRTNRFFGDAGLYWAKQATLPQSWCDCDKIDGDCGDNCINRALSYECDASNCNLGPERCTNRAFASLKERYKKPTKFNIGVEVTMTRNKGFGVRACRTFDEDQVIVEYAGEIITEDECQRRMKEDYKDAKSFYLMEFDQGMIIDATKGSMARFVNHSCRPNCEMRKWIVDKKPRMALFALRDIMTGEELTYDYNFEPTGDPQPCHCGADNCRGVIGPRTSKDKEKQREREQQHKKEEKAKRIATEKKKQQQQPQAAARKSATKAEPAQVPASKTSSAKAIVSNAIAGTKRKFKQFLSGSSKTGEEGEVSTQVEDRAARLQKRRRTSLQDPEGRVTSTPSLSRSKVEEGTQALLTGKSSKSVIEEKRIASTSTGATTLVNDSSSAIQRCTPPTEESFFEQKPGFTKVTAVPSPIKASSTPRSKLRSERRLSSKDEDVEAVESAKPPSTREVSSIYVAEPVARDPEPKSFFDSSSISPEARLPNPEQKGSRKPWASRKASRSHDHSGTKFSSFSQSMGQGTLEGFIKRSSTVKKVTEVVRKDRDCEEVAGHEVPEREGRNASEVRRGRSVRVVNRDINGA